VKSFQNFQDAKVLITGITGFKGSWLALTLLSLGVKVYGIALQPTEKSSLFYLCNLDEKCTVFYEDIRNDASVSSLILTISPDFIFHLAAQALVPSSISDPLYTWSTNVIGSANVLNSLRTLNSPCACVVITSDKCYMNNEWIWGYREIDKLGGSDPYSASKASAELVFSSFFETYFINHSLISISSARAGNVIGGGDWSPDRLIPDCIKHWRNGTTLLLRSPHSTRPWQHVLEPITGYMQLALSLHSNHLLSGESFNFGPNPSENTSVVEVVNLLSTYLAGSLKYEVDNPLNIKESSLLSLDASKAKSLLDWSPALTCPDAILWTAEWYQSFYDYPSNINSLTTHQISKFFN